jgi:hypothetical protein
MNGTGPIWFIAKTASIRIASVTGLDPSNLTGAPGCHWVVDGGSPTEEYYDSF